MESGILHGEDCWTWNILFGVRPARRTSISELERQESGNPTVSSLPWPQKVLAQSVISAQCSECQSDEVQTSVGKRRE